MATKLKDISFDLSALDEPKRTLHKLGMVQSARLIGYIEAEYAKGRLEDEAFAKQAAEALGFEISGAHVEVRRRELGIVSTRDQRKLDEKATLVERVARLEALLGAMQTKLAGLLR